jgi:hypothetical protein
VSLIDSYKHIKWHEFGDDGPEILPGVLEACRTADTTNASACLRLRLTATTPWSEFALATRL